MQRMIFFCALMHVTHIFCMQSQAGSCASAAQTSESQECEVQKKFAQWIRAQKEADGIRARLAVDKDVLILHALPRPLGLSIIRTYFDDIKRLTMRYREQLLPAVIAKPPYSAANKITTSDKQLLIASDKCATIHQSIDRQAHPIQIAKIIYSVYLVPSEPLHEARIFKNNARRNISNPIRLIGRPLRSNEYALVAWSDGSQHIALHTQDLQKLYDLSGDQIDFIRSLYKKNAYVLSDRQVEVCNSLPIDMRQNLEEYYPHVGAYFQHDQLRQMEKKQMLDMHKKIQTLQEEVSTLTKNKLIQQKKMERMQQQNSDQMQEIREFENMYVGIDESVDVCTRRCMTRVKERWKKLWGARE